MSLKYQPSQFEKKWTDDWDRKKIYKAPNPDKNHPKQFIFPMFPYPSGAGLHVGHVRVYTGTDVVARFHRMNGYAVLHPMGWDAFGLPAENAAIKAKKNPMDMVPDHIATFRRQMQSLGFSFDWDREFATTDPSYYKWTQWLFLQFYKMGLLYKKNTPINFCPSCKTGLAEEEVLANGTHERCGTRITKKELPQWLFKITSYADRLLEDLKGLDWPRGILEMQRNWIGKKEGINIDYKVKGTDEFVTCFTTSPVNFGATFLVVAPEYKLVKKILDKKVKVPEENYKEVKKYVDWALNESDQERLKETKEKTGAFTGLYAINHVNQKEIPIWIADFVLATVGTGAVQGCPGHDLRDFDFAKKFNLPIPRVVTGPHGETGPIEKREDVVEHGGVMVNSDFLNGIPYEEAMQKTMDYFEKKGWGKRVITYHLRDWIFSRQRYWGEPIPMIFCAKCAENQDQRSKIKDQNEMKGWYPIPESELPVKLPYVKSYEPTETGESPLAKIKNWVNVKCPNCDGPARRETDTMPNWAGSCWYFIAFSFWNQEKENPKSKILNSKQNQNPNDKNTKHSESLNLEHLNLFRIWNLEFRVFIDKWLPTDWYIGGAEHAVLHLLYARFWVKALYDLKLLHFKEPFTRLRNLGMILAEDHRKMSKSLGNVVNPDDVMKEYGVDALRVYEMFMAPFDQEIAWSTKALQGAYRFIVRIWKLFHDPKQISEASDKQLATKLQRTIAKVTRDIPEVKFNTAIAAMMEFINDWENRALSEEDAKRFLQILAPFTPFITEEIWHEVFGQKESIHLSNWPKVKGKIIEEEVVIPVQVNGKLRATIKVSIDDLSKTAVVNRSLKEEKVKKYLAGKKYRVIYVSGKILNFVTI